MVIPQIRLQKRERERNVCERERKRQVEREREIGQAIYNYSELLFT